MVSKKAKKTPTLGLEVPVPKKPRETWVTIFTTMIEEKDTTLDAYTGAQRLAKVQQNTVTKDLRVVHVEE